MSAIIQHSFRPIANECSELVESNFWPGVRASPGRRDSKTMGLEFVDTLRLVTLLRPGTGALHQKLFRAEGYNPFGIETLNRGF
jgi:hypothetical protein